MEIKELNDKKQIEGFFNKHWGGDFIVAFDRNFYAEDVLAFGAYENGSLIGLITYVFDNKTCKLVSLNALKKWQGIGTVLLNKLIEESIKNGCEKIITETSNDNIDGLRFYQKRGFKITALYPGAINEARKIKPNIPELGDYDIPLRDAIELENILK